MKEHFKINFRKKLLKKLLMLKKILPIQSVLINKHLMLLTEWLCGLPCVNHLKLKINSPVDLLLNNFVMLVVIHILDLILLIDYQLVKKNVWPVIVKRFLMNSLQFKKKVILLLKQLEEEENLEEKC